MKTVKSYSPKTKILSLILSFLIIFYLVPASVFAEGLSNDTSISDTPVSENEENNTYIPEIYEVTELREENVKHFRLGDGSYVAAQYNYPVHYLDENGEFEDIDNRLKESGGEFSTDNSRVKFIKKITGNGNIFTLHENNTKITMGLVGAEKKTKGAVTSTHDSDDTIENALGKMTNLENISSTILYEDILDGVDIEYIVHSVNIKENIIVKEKKDSYSYTFTLELNNLTAALTDNGSVHINSLDGETQYVIPAPVVFDANGIYAPDDVSAYTLTAVGNGKYEINVTVNASWMNDADRAFPIIIDPPMLSNQGGVSDFNIDSNNPNSNTNGDDNFYVSATERAYISFDESTFADIPIGATIMKAELSVIGGSSSVAPARVGAYAITSDWDGTLTWNKATSGAYEGSFSDTALDYVYLNDGNGRESWNITDLYKDWLSGAPNYGVGLRLVDESTTEAAHFTACDYDPSDDDTNLYEPAILVTYIYNDGLESYYPTSTHSAGVAGVGSINLSTGRLTLAIPTLTTTDHLFAFTPTLVYNSSLAGKPVTSAHTASALSTSYMPYGFKLNIQETIVKKSYLDEDGAERDYYLLYDADGTTHGFYSPWFSGPYYDDDGLQLTLTVGTDEITIEDIDHNIRTYSKINNSSWYLTSIADKFGNQLILYGENEVAGKPETIFVKPYGKSNIEMLRLLYEGDKLCAVYNNTSKDSVIFRYAGKKLYMVQYCYGNASTTEQNVRDTYNNTDDAVNVFVYSTAKYLYDNSGIITDALDNDTNKYVNYEISNKKIVSVSEYGGNTIGQQISYIYGEGYTDVITTGNDEVIDTADDIRTRYVFDGYGRSISVYSMSLDETAIYGATSGSYDNSEKSRNSIKSNVILDGVDSENVIKDSTGEVPLAVTLQGGIDKTEETGCYKKTVFEVEDVATVTESNANMEYVLSGFGKANSIILNDCTDFSLGVNIYYYQGVGKADEVVEYRFDFADVENVWQYVCGKFYCAKEPEGNINYNIVRKIEVVCNYYGHLDLESSDACAYFRDIALTPFGKQSGYVYNYDSTNGNLIEKENSLYYESYAYDEENRLVYVENTYGDICEYSYKKEDGITTHSEKYYRYYTFVAENTYTYNSYGLLIGTKYTGIDEDALVDCGEDEIISIVTQYGYITESDNTKPDSKIFGALSSETDTRGYTTKYFYDNTNGNLLAQIDVEYGRGYVYEYNDWGALEGVRPATGSATSYSGATTAENVSYEYDSRSKWLTKIITDSTEYSFSYDIFGNSAGVIAGDNTLATYEYYPHNGKLKKINYGNGFSEEYVYNTLEKLVEIWYTYDDGTSEKVYEYTYNSIGLLTVFEDLRADKNIEYSYDNNGRLIRIDEKDASTDSSIATSGMTYDAEGRLTFRYFSIDYDAISGIPSLIGQSSTYEYGENGLISKETHGSGSGEQEIVYVYDNLNRIERVERVCGPYPTFNYVTEYSYNQGDYYGYGENSSYLVDTYTSTVGTSASTYNYSYDTRGNITNIVHGSSETTYVYDDLGQLVEESDGRIICTYTYDNAGNIVSIASDNVDSDSGGTIVRAILPPPVAVVTENILEYSDSEWGDLLTSYDGHTITYDEIGNPLSYYNGSTYTFNWTGRRLTSAVKGSKTMSFTYNDEGIRTTKTVNGVKHTYHLNGSQIVAEEWGNKLIIYLYDASGSPIGMMYRTTSYAANVFDVFYFEKNLQGDIVAVYNSSGTRVASYSYTNAWGIHSTVYSNGGGSTGAQYNPFRYRGYYYDTDLGMYYLQSRYYDPNTCRFINADGYVSTGQGLIGNNMFAYCGNNPVNYVDYSGEFAISTLILIIVGVAAVTTAGAITYAALAEDTVVLDLSYSVSNEIKAGGSLLLDFEGSNIEFYPHLGQAYGASSGLSYSVGKVWNYAGPGSYKDFFLFGGFGEYMGVDGCFNPFDPTGAYAVSATFSMGTSAYAGWDWYFIPISFNFKEGKFNKINP